MCYYQVGNPTLYYTSISKEVKVYIKFTKIEKGVQVYLNAGSDVRNMTKSFVTSNNTVTVGD
jgi:hypothetical protein